MKKLAMVAMVVGMAMIFLAGCAFAPVSKGNFQDLNERVEILEIAVGNNIDRLDKVETYVKAVAKLRATINSHVKRTGQLEDLVNYASPKVYAFWARGFISGSSTLPEKMKAQLDVLVSALKKENILIKKIVGYSDTAGNIKANEALSMRRAESVKVYLTTVKGLNLINVKIVSAGETSRYGSKRDNRCVAIIGKRGATPYK